MNIEKVSPEFATDLIKLINSCKGIKYNAKVDITTKSGKRINFEYTTLDKIYAHVKSNNDFALLEPIGTNEAGQPAVQIILIHKSGEAITSDYYALNLPLNGSKQDEGSAITYTKRYALGSFLGISTDVDNDANSGEGGMKIPNYRDEFILICKKKGIDPVAYAKEHGINKKTTQAEYQKIVMSLQEQNAEQNDETNSVVSMNELCEVKNERKTY